MASSPRKPTAKPSRSKNPNARIVKRVVKNTGKKYKKRSLLPSMVALALLIAITGLIVTFAWISFLFIFNPQQVAWLNKFLPEWVQFNVGKGERPQTLPQIQAAITKQGLVAGEKLAVDNDGSFLLPIYKQRLNCHDYCQEMVELRLYQQATDLEFQSQPKQYYQASQIAIAGPEESFVAAPLVNDTDENPGSSIALPLTEIQRFDVAPSPGVWFYLRGQRQERTYNTAYGHILYYNPKRAHLQQMQSWTSPKGELPQWQQVTGGGANELVINQTVGLEPQVRVYQVKSIQQFLNPVELEEITLNPPAWKNQTYEKALSIARSGLWTPAYEWLQSFKKQQKTIPVAAQAQIDVIRLHAQLSKIQADTSWASPSQEVLADLIDGRWEKALQVFKGAPPQNTKEIGTLLKGDRGRLWGRVEAALQVNSNRPEVKAWGALILAAQQGEGRVHEWVKEKFKDKSDSLTEIQNLLKQLRGEVVTSQMTAAHTSRIVGSVQNITKVNPVEWLRLDPKTDLSKINQSYQVQVSAFHNGKNWLYAPFNNINLPNSPEFLRSMGLDSDPVLQIAVWLPNGEQQTTAATTKAVQLKNGVLRLLVTSPVINPLGNNKNSYQPQPLAITASALEWVQPSPITLEALHQQNPQRAKVVLPAVWRLLQASNLISAGNVPSVEQIRQKIGHWPVQEIDLTGNGKPETILSVSPEAIASLLRKTHASLTSTITTGHLQNQSRPRTLILSDNGSIIYTDFSKNSQQSLTAIANLWQTPLSSLLIDAEKQYILKRWSEKNQRFE